MPILLIHGFLATTHMLLPLKWRLERRGFSVFIAKLSPLALRSVEHLSDQLAVEIERVLRVSGAKQVDLVGLSLGGLVGLYTVQRNAHLKQVRTLITIGTPFQGTWSAALTLPLFAGLSRGIWQNIPGSRLLLSLKETGVPENIRLVAICISGDWIAPPSRCVFDGFEVITLKGWSTPLTHQWQMLSSNTLDTLESVLYR